MKKIPFGPTNVNDIPVIIVRDHHGHVQEKISLNEMERRNKQSYQSESQQIRDYRKALEYYSKKEYLLAEELFLQLIAQSQQGLNYQYYERLANIYRQQQRLPEELNLLNQALTELQTCHGVETLIKKIERRIEEVKKIQQKTYKDCCLE